MFIEVLVKNSRKLSSEMRENQTAEKEISDSIKSNDCDCMFENN